MCLPFNLKLQAEAEVSQSAECCVPQTMHPRLAQPILCCGNGLWRPGSVCELKLLRSLQFQTTVDSVGNDCALNVSCRAQQAGLMLVAGVGVLACITARRGFLIDALGKQLVGFMFPNQSVRSKQGVQRY